MVTRSGIVPASSSAFLFGGAKPVVVGVDVSDGPLSGIPFDLGYLCDYCAEASVSVGPCTPRNLKATWLDIRPQAR